MFEWDVVIKRKWPNSGCSTAFMTLDLKIGHDALSGTVIGRGHRAAVLFCYRQT